MMAKKKHQPKPPQVDADGYVTTGIYSYFRGSEADHPDEYDKAMHHCHRTLRESPNELFDRIRSEFEEVLRERKASRDQSEWQQDAAISECLQGTMLANTVEQLAGDSIPKQLLHYLIQLGELLERVKVRQFEGDVVLGQKRREVSALGGRSTAKLSDQEWPKVRKFIDRRLKRNPSLADACKDASKQLATGTFSGINRRVSISLSALQKRYSKK